MNCHLPILILALIGCLSLHGQPAIFKNYSLQDGLVSNQVRSIYQDKAGFIWIATMDGLSRYDGNGFTNFTTDNGLNFDLVNDLYEDEAGDMYVALNNGVTQIIRRDKVLGKCKTGFTINRFIRDGKKVYAICDLGGIAEFKHGQLQPHASRQLGSIMDLARLNDSLFVVLDADYHPLILDRDFKVFSPGNAQMIIQSIAVDASKRVFLCGSQGLLLLSQRQTRNSPLAFEPLPGKLKAATRGAGKIYNLFQDADANYWVSGRDKLVRLSPSGQVQEFTTQDGLPANLVTAFYQDREKNLWMCSELGVAKLVMLQDLQYHPGQSRQQGSSVYRIIPASAQGFYYLNGKNLVYLNQATGVSNIVLRDGVFYDASFDVPRQQLFAVSGNNIITLQNGTSTSTSAGPGLHFLQMQRDQRGNIFLSSFDGIWVKPPGRPARHFALHHRITCMLLGDENDLWVGTWNSGLYRLQLQYAGDSVAGTIQNFTSVTGDSVIRSLYKDTHKTIWIGTRYNGIVALQQQEGNWQVKRLSKKDGLSANWVTSFAEDRRGNIWVGSRSGLNKLIPSPHGYRIFNYNRLHQYFGEINAIYPDTAGRIWCAGYNGLMHFTDNRIDSLPAPRVFVTRVIAGKDSFSFPEKLPSLEYSVGSISFTFSAPTYINEKSMLYSYRLLGGEDSSWSTRTNQHTVSFANIPAGSYAFELRAFGWNGLPGEVSRLAFVVRPPFWRTTWFYLLMMLTASGLVYGLYRYRIRQLLRWQHARDRIAKDLHDDIGSSLTNISILSELSRKHLEEPATAVNFLGRIQDEVQRSGQAMDDIIWSVNSRNDSLEETFARMRRFTDELLEASGISYELEIDAQISHQKIQMEQRRDFYLVYKEILNNIVKHAAASKVIITVTLLNNELKLVVIDNGKGFDTAMTSSRNGLKNLEHRAKKWQGHLQVSSASNAGTNLTVTMPLAD